MGRKLMKKFGNTSHNSKSEIFGHIYRMLLLSMYIKQQRTMKKAKEREKKEMKRLSNSNHYLA
jgi:hypothetical protein